MGVTEIFDDAAVESLLQGQPTADDALAPLVPVVTALRTRTATEPVPAMSPALQAQCRGTQDIVSLDARRRGRGLLGKTAAAAAVISIGLVGVAAAQNRLPSDLQDVVSSTAGLVGIEVPSAGDRGHVDHTELERGRYEDGTTPGGATPADPGTPGDGEPATPATAPEPPGKPEATPGVTAGPPASTPADDVDADDEDADDEDADDEGGKPDDVGADPPGKP